MFISPGFILQNREITCYNVSHECPSLSCNESEAEFVDGECCKQCPGKLFITPIYSRFDIFLFYYPCAVTPRPPVTGSGIINLNFMCSFGIFMLGTNIIHFRGLFLRCIFTYIGCYTFNGEFVLEGGWWHPTLPEYGVVTCVNCTCQVWTQT